MTPGNHGRHFFLLEIEIFTTKIVNSKSLKKLCRQLSLTMNILKKSIYQFIKNCLFLSFSAGIYVNKCSAFWIPSMSALHDSQSAFLQRFQKVLLVLLLFDIVLCLILVTVSFLLKIQLLDDHCHNIILSFWFYV